LPAVTEAPPRTPRLKYLELSDICIFVELGRGLEFPKLRELVNVGLRLSDRQAWRLLRAIDADIGKFVAIADIVEEVVNFVFRGRYEKEIEAPAIQLICYFEFAGEYQLRIEYEPQFDYYYDGKEVHYKCHIGMKLTRLYFTSRIDETTRGLVENLIDELAEIFEKPVIKELKGSPYTIMLYENELVLRATVKAYLADNVFSRIYDNYYLGRRMGGRP
jgi:hypothetical protein